MYLSAYLYDLDLPLNYIQTFSNALIGYKEKTYYYCYNSVYLHNVL